MLLSIAIHTDYCHATFTSMLSSEFKLSGIKYVYALAHASLLISSYSEKETL